jgi:hypothetical protein
MELFKKMITEAEQGKNIIDKCITDLEGIEKSKIILLFPDGDAKTLEISFRYLDVFLSSYDIVVVISSVDISKVYEHTAKQIIMTQISNDEMGRVLRYVSMVSISAIKILSLSKPYHRKAETLVGFKDITEETLVIRCLYEIFQEIDEVTP